MSLIVNPHRFGIPFTGLLDTYSGAEAAYSLRKLRAAYSGAAIRVRRSNDNAESDVSFTSSGDLDETALTAFVGANSAYVTTWYDQSGNARSATQSNSALQPRIVNAGTIDKDSGKPAVFLGDFPVGNKGLRIDNVGTLFYGEDRPLSVFAVYTSTDVTEQQCLFSFRVNSGSNYAGTSFRPSWTNPISPNTWGYYKSQDSGSFQAMSGGQIYSNQRYLVQLIDTGTYTDAYANDIASAMFSYPINVGFQSLDSGVLGAEFETFSPLKFNRAIRGYLQEVIFYRASKASDRTGIRNNINNYFAVYDPNFVGVLDTYSGTTAAYSVRRLRKAYWGPSLRVRRSNDNAEQDIRFDISGNLDEAALTAFVGSNSAYVVKWYDQTGNGQNAEQATTNWQPRIVNAGTIDKVNGKVAVFFNRASNPALSIANLAYNYFAGEDVPLSLFIVFKDVHQVSDYLNLIWMGDDESSSRFNVGISAGPTQKRWEVARFAAYWPSTYDYNFWQSSESIPKDTQQIGQIIFSGTTVNAYHNATQDLVNKSLDVGELIFTKAFIGAADEGFYANSFDGYIQEVIISNWDKSSDRTGIRDNINTYFGVY